MQLAQTKPLLALRYTNRYRETWHHEQLHHLFYRLAVNGQAQIVLTWAIELAHAHHNSAEIQGCAALIAAKAGEIRLASNFIHRALSLDPESKKWQHVRDNLWQM